jgi:predicted dehydrogenase
MKQISIAFIGCGYVADLYAQTLANHGNLKLVGAYDRDVDRQRAFCAYYGIPGYADLDDLLGDPAVEIVVNLTNPRSHFEVTRRCLEAGKHVYSEKPLGMTAEEARFLVELARRQRVSLAGAPCTMLSESAQTLWRAVQSGMVGQVRLVYAEMEDGMVHREKFRKWRSCSGAPWPAMDEFEVGCTFEHAGYQLAILATMFGPARRVTSFSSCRIPDKAPDLMPATKTPDFSVGCIEFADGTVARLTCGVVGPANRSLTVIGDIGCITLVDVWDYHSPVLFNSKKHGAVARRLETWFGVGRDQPVPLVHRKKFRSAGWANSMDFARGIAEQAAAIAENRPCRLSGELAMHITEVTAILQTPGACARQTVTSTFSRPEPMPWVQEGAADKRSLCYVNT